MPRRHCRVLLGTLPVLIVANVPGALRAQRPSELGRAVTVTVGRQPALDLADPGRTWSYDRGAGGTGTAHSGARLRAAAQWTQTLDIRWPLGAASPWAVVGTVTRGSGRGTALTGVSATSAPLGTSFDSTAYNFRGLTSWRGSFGVSRTLFTRRGAVATAQAAGLYGTVRAPARLECTPVPQPATVSNLCTNGGDLRLATPGLTLSTALWSPPWYGLRLRLTVGGDALRVNERQVYEQLLGPSGDFAPFGAPGPAVSPGRRWRLAPSFGIGAAYSAER